MTTHIRAEGDAAQLARASHRGAEWHRRWPRRRPRGSSRLLAAPRGPRGGASSGPPGARAARQWRAAAGPSEPEQPQSQPGEEEDVEEFLLPEEDEEIPGSYRDAMNPNKPLGRAVANACEELDHLGELERDQLQQADALLKQLGVKKSIFDVPEADGDADAS
ncbi:unnamed protein product [Pedinophyceae sp. YPF-701]|nr:unnamed protein product [Pedinophyceae sp. YPF-701]